MAVPYTFANATVSIPLSQLDSNFATAITLGNTAIQLGNTVTTLNNMTLANVTVSSGNATFTTANVTNMSSSNVTITGGTIANVTISGSGSNITATNINASNVTVSTDLTLSGGTANGVAYLNGSKVLTTGSALTFDGTTLTAPQMTLTSSNGITMNSVSGGLIDSSGNTLFIQFPAANSLIFRQSGSPYAEYMRLTSTGLGIGTSSPGAPLEVFRTSTTAAAVRLRYNSTSYYGEHGMDANGNYVVSSPSANGVTSGNLLLRSGTNTIFTVNNNSYVSPAMTLDSSGNLGLGVTPSAWYSGWKAFDLGAGGGFYSNGTNNVALTANAYNSDGSGGWKYKGSGNANLMQTSAGQFLWYTAPSGTAGNAISFTQAMTLDASGNLGIGTSSPASELHVAVTGNIRGSSSGSDSLNLYGGVSGTANRIQVRGASHPSTPNIITFDTNSSERMRIDSDGNLLVGTTSADAQFVVTNSATSGWAARILKSSGSGTPQGLQVVVGQNSSNEVFQCSQGTSFTSPTNLFKVQGNGLVNTGAASSSPYNNTTASAANMTVTSTGDLQRSTSSLKYKTDVKNATHGLAELLTLRSVTYKGKNDGDTVFGGLIAEEVDAAGLTEFVQYAEDGTPDALAYGNMVSLCIKAIQEQQALIIDLQDRLTKAGL